MPLNDIRVISTSIRLQQRMKDKSNNTLQEKARHWNPQKTLKNIETEFPILHTVTLPLGFSVFYNERLIRERHSHNATTKQETLSEVTSRKVASFSTVSLHSINHESSHTTLALSFLFRFGEARIRLNCFNHWSYLHLNVRSNLLSFAFVVFSRYEHILTPSLAHLEAPIFRKLWQQLRGYLIKLHLVRMPRKC